MALVALIAAYHESEEAGLLRATLPLAGRTVVERQARLAAKAGASPIVLLVERIPAELGAAIERLRRERLPIVVARSAEEASEAVDPSDRLVLVADGAIAEADQLARIAAAEGAAVLTVPDAGFGELYERIDGQSRWAGLAAVDGAMLRKTVGMLRDWDLQSTLLRRALQGGARHVAAEGPVAILDGWNDLAGLERQILAIASESRGGWASRLLAPFERMVTLAVMGGRTAPSMLGTAAGLLNALGAGAILYGWLRTGLGLMLAATPLEGAADRLARIRMQGDAGRSWWGALIPAVAGGALLALGYKLAVPFGWGMVLLAIVALAFLIAQGIETGGRPIRGSLLLAERRGLTWLLLPFAIAGAWNIGLALLFAYSAASFFWAQQQVHTVLQRP